MLSASPPVVQCFQKGVGWMAGRRMTVTTGWGWGKKVTFVAFAHGQGGLRYEKVGPTTTVISATPGDGEVLVKLEGEVLACWYRNLDPTPCRVVVVDAKHSDEAAMRTVPMC